MSTETETPPALPKSPTPLPKSTWNKEEFLARLAELERRKDDPEHIAYVQRGAEGAAGARRIINEQERRRLDEAGWMKRKVNKPCRFLTPIGLT